MHYKLKAAERTKSAGFTLIAIMAMLSVIGVGFVSYLMLSNQNNMSRFKRAQSSESAHDLNIANLAIAGALLQFPTNQPAVATNLAFLPAMYPDPYISTGNAPALWFGPQSSGVGGVWTPVGNQGLQIAGFDSTNLPDQTLNNVFVGGSSPVLGGSGLPLAQPSTVNFVKTVVGPNYLIQALVVDSTATLPGKAGNALSHVQAQLAVPAPPPPVLQITSTYSPTAPVGSNQNFTVNVTLYGIAYDVNANVVGSTNPPQDYNLFNGSLPAQAGSITNGGLDLTLTLPATAALVTPMFPGAPVGTLKVTVNATGPGNVPAAPLTVTVYVDMSVVCSFSPAAASQQIGSNQPYQMLVEGPVASTQITNVFSGASTTASSLNVTVPAWAVVGQPYLGTGQVYSTDGSSNTCSYTLIALAPPPPPPPPATPPPPASPPAALPPPASPPASPPAAPPSSPATGACKISPTVVTMDFYTGPSQALYNPPPGVTLTMTYPTSYTAVGMAMDAAVGFGNNNILTNTTTNTNSITIQWTDIPFYQSGLDVGFNVITGQYPGGGGAIGTDGTQYSCSYTLNVICSGSYYPCTCNGNCP